MSDPSPKGVTDDATDMAVQMLRYANGQKVADALTSHGYSVTRMTVNRWARGSEMPGIARRMILVLFGHSPDMTKAPPPEWAAAMEQRLRLELERNRVLIEALAPADIREAAARVIERLEALPLPDGVTHDESDAEEGPGAAVPPGREPESRRGQVDG